MKYLFDTSSLLALARYYIPFDKERNLYEWLRGKYDSKEMVLLDAIIEESKYVAHNIIQKTFPFLFVNNYLIINTTDLLPCNTKRFDNLVNNNFAISSLTRNNKVDFSILKQNFLNSGDGKIVLYAYNCIQNGQNDFYIVTEETRYSNDNKPFKKIPSICEIINAPCLSVVDLLSHTSMKIIFGY